MNDNKYFIETTYGDVIEFIPGNKGLPSVFSDPTWVKYYRRSGWKTKSSPFTKPKLKGKNAKASYFKWNEIKQVWVEKW